MVDENLRCVLRVVDVSDEVNSFLVGADIPQLQELAKCTIHNDESTYTVACEYEKLILIWLDDSFCSIGMPSNQVL
jgi:hypothetical protein